MNQNLNEAPPRAAAKVTLPLFPASPEGGCGCGAPPPSPATAAGPSLVGTVPSPRGEVPQVSARLTGRDRWGAFKARWGVGRMRFAVAPGLYALGSPGPEAPVLVSANYQMSFDGLRSALPGRDAWILVLDTKGINVWCAAGKGTFGTEELVARIGATGLGEVVSHRTLTLPQLSAPGVAAHEVQQRTGFSVRYGPVAAADLPAYLDRGGQADPAMRRKVFPLRERAVLIPVELLGALKPALLVAPLLYLSGGLGGPEGFWQNAAGAGTFAVLAFLASVAAGTVLFPLLLPLLPGRAFAAKGLVLGGATGLAVWSLQGLFGPATAGTLGSLAWVLLCPAVTAYLALNFTGCATYTSPSGVRKEMRWSLPLCLGLAVAGLGLWLASRFLL